MNVDKFALRVTSGKPETFDSLVNGEYSLRFVTEDADNYYMMQDRGGPYYHTMWAINKKTGKSTCIDLMDYMFKGIEEQTTKIDPPYDKLRIGT